MSRQLFSPRTFRLSDPVDCAREQVERFTTKLTHELSDERIAELRMKSERAVDALRTNHKRREFFDGKRILTEFYRRHLHSTGMSKEIFIYNCAQAASSRKAVCEFVEGLFERLGVSGPLGAEG